MVILFYCSYHNTNQQPTRHGTLKWRCLDVVATSKR